MEFDFNKNPNLMTPAEQLEYLDQAINILKSMDEIKLEQFRRDRIKAYLRTSGEGVGDLGGENV